MCIISVHVSPKKIHHTHPRFVTCDWFKIKSPFIQTHSDYHQKHRHSALKKIGSNQFKKFCNRGKKGTSIEQNQCIECWLLYIWLESSFSVKYLSSWTLPVNSLRGVDIRHPESEFGSLTMTSCVVKNVLDCCSLSRKIWELQYIQVPNLSNHISNIPFWRNEGDSAHLWTHMGDRLGAIFGIDPSILAIRIWCRSNSGWWNWSTGVTGGVYGPPIHRGKSRVFWVASWSDLLGCWLERCALRFLRLINKHLSARTMKFASVRQVNERTPAISGAWLKLRVYPG